MRTAWCSAVALLCLVLFVPAARAADQPKNLLFFGNSFTYGNSPWDVPRVVKEIATAAGHATPNVVMQANGGWTLSDHISKVNSDGAGSVLHALGSGQTWDAFVLQDYSTRPTVGPTGISADRAGHRADVVTLGTTVLAHSPSATPILFETWARSPGNGFYPGTFPNASVMQEQLREGYALSAGDLNSALGAPVARIAPVGDAFETWGWFDLYDGDLYHANNKGSLLAGLVLYSQIYSDWTTSNIDLTSLSLAMGLGAFDGAALTAIVDSVVPEPSSAMLLMLGCVVLGARRRGGSGA